MGISVSALQETGYRSMKVTGAYSRSDAQSLIDRIYADSSETHCDNCLLDISELVGNVPSMDRFDLAEYAAKIWNHSIRVAIVYRAEDISKFFEDVTVNRGGWTTVVPDVQTALEWLIGNTPSKPDAGAGK